MSLEWIEGFIQNGFSDDTLKMGYLDYIFALSLMFESHHKTEDVIGFAYFREALSDTYFEWLFEDHDLITGFLNELAPIHHSLRRNESVYRDLISLKVVLMKIEDRWSQHIGLEEEEFVNLIDGISTQEEKSQLIAKFLDFNRGYLIPNPNALPFMFYNLQPEDRSLVTKMHPKDWFIHLHSPEWAENWQAMKPFY